jgi:uracil-DNA glycosylase
MPALPAADRALREVARVKRRAYRDWEYWGKPVPSFGDPRAELLIVGLAPGAHGSNRTGRMFTGDMSGNVLYRVLHKPASPASPKAFARRRAAPDRMPTSRRSRIARRRATSPRARRSPTAAPYLSASWICCGT